MALSKQETKQLLERLIFVSESPQEWVQDVWDMSPTLGESAARLLEAFEATVESCPEERLEALLEGLYRDRI
jgi:hypothetical protein